VSPPQMHLVLAPTFQRGVHWAAEHGLDLEGQVRVVVRREQMRGWRAPTVLHVVDHVPGHGWEEWSAWQDEVARCGAVGVQVIMERS